MTNPSHIVKKRLRDGVGEAETPVRAFERFIQLVGQSPAGRIQVSPEDLFRLLRPFLVNPERHEKQVREMVRVMGYIMFNQEIDRVFGMRQVNKVMSNVFGLFKGTMEQSAPHLMKRLKSLGESLLKDLKPVNTVVYIKPIRYIDTPPGYGELVLHRFRFEAQLAVEPNSDDEPEAVDVKLTIERPEDDIIIEAISPQPGFSAVGVKQSTGLQVGRQETETSKDSLESEVSGGVARTKGGSEFTHGEQTSRLVSFGAEHSVSRVEQFLVARKAGNRAFWHAVAGVGPFDVGGIDYLADVLVPNSVNSLTFRFESSVYWRRAGATPLEVRRTFMLPRPAILPSMLTQ